ncbi:uncharacterized protein PFB0145c-like [Dendronephthya gigantea]|uniref:uncharacterized protein PFB0145c-like n=1 Tax=Dendronephthya gigantea TaxID=151771 RepID=UPI00106BEFCC|nr:uncharacterized protein PFB0145c-like [Dendronephthya gigantea]
MQSNIAPSRIISQKSQNVKTTTSFNSQKLSDAITPEQSKITLGKTISMQANKNGTKGLQTVVHHTKLTNKDGTLDIVNKLQQSPKQTPHAMKPKVIHSKQEAISEIFRALGSNSKIVKDANGLYLISGKHVKILHRTHGGVDEGRNRGNNENEGAKSVEKPGEVVIESNLPNDLPSNSTPLSQINSTNYQQSLASNAFNIHKEVGLDLSNYNLKDLGHKLHSEPKLGFLENGTSENTKTNNTVLPPKERDDLSVESINEKQPQRKFNNDSYFNSIIPNEVNNNAVLSMEENKNFHKSVKQSKWKFDDAYSNGTVPNSINNTALPVEENDNLNMDNINKKQSQFNDAFSNSSTKLVEQHDSDLGSFTSNYNNDDDSTDNKKLDASDKELSDVQIEVVDEAKEENSEFKNQSTEVNKDTENLEIIDEGESNQSALKITPEDISSALQEKFKQKAINKNGPTEPAEEPGNGGLKSGKLLQNSAGSPGIISLRNASKPGTWSNISSFKASVAPPTQSTDETRFGLKKSISQLKNSEAQKKTGSKSQTSGSTWSMDILGVVGRPQNNPSKQLDGLHTRKISESKQRAQWLQQASKVVKGTSKFTNASQEPIMVGKQAEQGTSRITNLPREPMIVSKQVEHGKTGITNLPREQMIPRRIVNSLLLSIAQKLQRKNEYIPMSNHKKDLNQAFESDTTGIDNHILEHINHNSRPSKFKNMTTAEDRKLDNLLDKFVKLISRHRTSVKTVKPKPKVKSRKKFKILDTIPLLKRQEKLLGREQQKLEHDLEMENKLLVGSKEKENIDSSESFSTNDEVKLKKKIQELNTEKKYLLKKFKTLGFQEKFSRGDGNMLMIPDQEASLTEVYDGSGQKTRIAPHVTFLLNDKGLNKETGFESKVEQADKQLRRVLADYDALLRSPHGGNTEGTEFNEDTRDNYEDHTRRTPNTAEKFNDNLIEENRNHEIFPLEKGFKDTELTSDSQELHKGKSTNIRDFDNIPRNTANQNSDDIPAYHQRTSEYINTHPSQNDAYIHKPDPTLTKSVFSDPTLSFINKEANYASDTAEKFEESIRQSKKDDDNNSENLDQQVRNSHSKYKKSSSGQGGIGASNVFPGTYNYNEGREGTQSTPNWRHEDETLLNEMPEYSAKDNTVESEGQSGHYMVMTIPKESDLEFKPQGMNIAGSYTEIKPKVTNNVGSVGNENTAGIQGFRSGGVQPPKEIQESIPKAFSQRSYGFSPDRSETLRQSNSLDSIHSKMYPQTSDIVESTDIPKVSEGNELRSSFRNEGSFRYTNPEFHQPEVNRIAIMGSNVEEGQYNIPASGRISETQGMPVTNSMGSEGDESQGNSRQPMENEIDGAFDVVNGGEEPTLQRNTNNPEDGVQDKTYINGDEYHLQKKHKIESKSKQ